MSVPKKRRQQLPPQIKKIELETRTRGKPNIRYQITADTGVHPDTGKRIQYRKRWPTEDEAREDLAKILASVDNGTYIHDNKLTVADMITTWIDSKHKLKPSTRHGYQTTLSPVVQVLGHIEIQKLKKSDVDQLVILLRKGGLPTVRETPRKPWTARTVNYMLSIFGQACQGQVKQGALVRNVVALVDRLPGEQEEMKTWTADDVQVFLESCVDDDYRHAWNLALSGLRRGEICGLRWDSVDLDGKTLTVAVNRVTYGKEITEGTPKSKRSKRTLPLPDDLVRELKSARARQAAAKMKLGEAWTDTGYVVIDGAGRPLAPGAVSSRWFHAVGRAKVSRIRLHDARHTCATLMHLRHVPMAVIAAWLGHSSSGFTQATYTHSQDPALLLAAGMLPVVHRL